MRNNPFALYAIRSYRAALIWVAVVALLLSACGVQQPKVYRVGVLSGLDFVASVTDGFKTRMTELGYIEGQNIVYDVQRTDFDIEAYQRILRQFVADQVDLILVFPTEASVEAKVTTQGTGIPVVFAFAFIEGVDLVNSVREPGGNLTGVRFPGPDIALKRFEIMRELVPQVKRIWIPYQRGYPVVPSQLAVLYPAAAAAGITLIEVPADDATELAAELKARAGSNDSSLDAILILAEPLGVTPEAFAVLGRFAIEHNLPIGGALMEAEGYHSIFGINANPVGAGQQAAVLANKVLKGTPPGTIPVVSAESFFQIDYKAALALGVTVPEGLLKQADEIIR